MIDVIDKKQIQDSVITVKENTSKDGIVLYPCFWRVLKSILCLVMHISCVRALKLLSGFSEFFGAMSGFFWWRQVGTWQPCHGQDQGRTKGGVGVNPPLSLIFCKNFIIRRVYRAWFFTKIKGVCVEEYAYDVNKLRLKTWIWLQIVTS